MRRSMRKCIVLALLGVLMSAFAVVPTGIASADNTAPWPQVVSKNYSQAQATLDGGVVASTCNNTKTWENSLIGSFSPSGSLLYENFGNRDTPYAHNACSESTVTKTGDVISYGSDGTGGVVRASNASGVVWSHLVTTCDGTGSQSLQSKPRYAPTLNTVTYFIRAYCQGVFQPTLVALDASTGAVKFRTSLGASDATLEALNYADGYVYFKYPGEFVYLNHLGQKDTSKSFMVSTTYNRAWAVSAEGTVVTMADSSAYPCDSKQRDVTFHPPGGSSFTRVLPANSVCSRIYHFEVAPNGSAVFIDKVGGVWTLYIVPQSTSKPVVATPLAFPSSSGQPNGNFTLYGNLAVDVYGNVVIHSRYFPSSGGPGQAAVLMYDLDGQLKKTFSTESLAQNGGEYEIYSGSVGLTRGYLYVLLLHSGTRVLHKIPFAGVGVDYPRGKLLGNLPGTRDYVALGDSFSSGEGVEPYDAETDIPGTDMCHRSGGAYARLLNGDPSLLLDLGADGFRACSGAETQHVKNVGWQGEDPQSEYLSTATDVVTLTIGGNDIGFGNFANACVGVIPPAHCGFNSPAYADALHKINNELPAKLASTYELVLQEAPNAEIYILGYPHVAPEKTPTDPMDPRCPFLYYSGYDANGDPIFWDDARAARDVVMRINSHIESIIWDMREEGGENLRLHYVEVNGIGSPFEGHEMCSSGDSYFQNLDQYPENKAAPFHPNAQGQAAYAELVAAAMLENAG